MEEKLRALLENCMLCPRKCGVNRLAGEKGFCGGLYEPVIARAALHFWEEPCVSGKEGSGTVFFSGCTLRCAYCQNAAISRGEAGVPVGVERLADIFFELEEKGANNVNLVTPSHYAVPILEAIRMARARGFRLPFVYNCSGYESVETLRLLDGMIDIYLTDFRYFNSQTATRYSKAPDYPEAAKAALAEMVRQKPAPEFDERDVMTKGVIVRLLLLPGYVEEAKRIVEYLCKTYGNKVYLSLMNQYTPFADASEYPEINRKVTSREYERLVDFALMLGVENAFIQEGGAASESFIPPFDGEGVLPK